MAFNSSSQEFSYLISGKWINKIRSLNATNFISLMQDKIKVTKHLVTKCTDVQKVSQGLRDTTRFSGCRDHATSHPKNTTNQSKVELNESNVVIRPSSCSRHQRGSSMFLTHQKALWRLPTSKCTYNNCKSWSV